jgi:hypothetical protein
MSARPQLRTLALAAAALLVSLLVAFSTAAPVPPAPVDAGELGLVADARPTNAAKIFKWGFSAWEDEFIKPLSKQWRTSHKKRVRNQVGMLTLDASRRSGTVWATVPGHGRKLGRWEARVRSEQNGGGGRKYRVLWELIPAGKYACGSKNLEISSYRVGDRRAKMQIRTPKGTKFSAGKRRNLKDNVWHTYAVEVTKKRISWFVDTKVVRTERRDAALTGTEYQMRFRLAGVKGKRMNPTRMQMDWVRYYTLERPNAKSVEAPSTNRGSFKTGC